MMEQPIYLDYSATTPLLPEVVDAMTPFLREHFGNPSSAHALGRAARDAVEVARGHVAALLRCDADEVVFTSGGTESDNFAIRGVTSRPSSGWVWPVSGLGWTWMRKASASVPCVTCFGKACGHRFLMSP